MDLIGQLDDAFKKATVNFSSLSTFQLNWKPEPQKWSIAQCLDHLIKSDGSFYTTFDKILSGEHRLSFFQRISPLKKIFGPLLVKALAPQTKRKLSAPKIFRPAGSNISSSVVLEFNDHLQKLKNYFIQLQHVNPNKVIASPVTPFITYSLRDAMQFISNHGQRHVNQALNVLHHSNFPKQHEHNIV